MSVNIKKTKVMIFNTSRAAMQRHVFHWDSQPIEIVSSYLYLGVLFSGPIFSLRQAGLTRLRKGHASLVQMERHCFQHLIQDADTKCRLFDTLVTPTVMYAAESWYPSMLPGDWARISRLQVSMLSRMIRSKPSVPHQIILAEFAAPPLQLEATFRLITFMQRTLDLHEGRYPRAALVSSRSLHEHGHAFSWFSTASKLLQSWDLSIDDLPTGSHEYIRDFLFRAYMQKTWQGSLSVKPLFYSTHFLQLDERGLPILPSYLSTEISFGLRFRMGQFRVSSHQLSVETGRYQGIPHEARFCPLCSSGEVEDEHHFLLRCPIYYEIRGRFHCLFRDQPSLQSIVSYEDPRCVGLLIREMITLRAERLASIEGQETSDQYSITDFFSRCRKRESDHSSSDELVLPVTARDRHRRGRKKRRPDRQRPTIEGQSSILQFFGKPP